MILLRFHIFLLAMRRQQGFIVGGQDVNRRDPVQAHGWIFSLPPMHSGPLHRQLIQK